MNDADIPLRLDTIHTKLTKLKSLDKNFSTFGSFSHKYKINDRLNKEDIQKYQIQNNITLPEEYAQFLIHIGNGGAGPCYGLFPLEKNENQVSVSEPFPYDFEHPFFIADKYEEFYNRAESCKTAEEEDAIWEEKDKIAETDYENSNRGFIDLCHEGCAMYDILIVNGMDSGTVWFFDFANDFGTAPLINPKDGKPMKFLDWYELWLDSQIGFFEGNPKYNEDFGSYGKYIKQK